jgi:hydrogenase maturation factor
MSKISAIFIGTLLISLGVAGTMLYQELKNQRLIDGIYAKGVTHEVAMEIANNMDKRGDWVCVNVAYDMPLERAYDVCIHECSHRAFDEIFAERCEKDINKCLEIIK